MPLRYAAASLNEGHLVDFAHGGHPDPGLGQAAFAQGDHALVAGHTLDFGSRSSINNHLANSVGKVQQFADRGAAMVTGAGTLQAAGAFAELRRLQKFRFDPHLLSFSGRYFFGSLAIRADDANQALGHDAVQRRDEVVGFYAHVNEAADDVSDVVGVNRG